jgi:hypothetical protein
MPARQASPSATLRRLNLSTREISGEAHECHERFLCAGESELTADGADDTDVPGDCHLLQR